MDISERFDDIRPYYDHEVKPAIERLLVHPHFDGVLSYLFEDMDKEDLLKR